MNNDIQMTRDGDLALVHYDIVPTDSIEQAIMIHLRWFLGEWVYNTAYGVPYFEQILIKNPNRLLVRRIIADEIMKVDGVTKVSDVTLAINRKTREGRIGFKAETNQGHLDLMETLDFFNHDLGMKVYVVNNRLVIEKSGPYVSKSSDNRLTFTQLAQASVEGGRLQLENEV